MRSVSEPGGFSAEKAEWWIRLVLDKAGELRRAGVCDISVDGCGVKLLPIEPEPPKFADVKNEPSLDGLPALNDPASYADGIVPGFVIERLDPEE
jgi:hypothetical protein